MVRLGAWSTALFVLALQALALALVLWFSNGNRQANRLLAALMIVIAGLLTPFILGYAGAYDAWPRLTFAPFSIPLAVGPLLYAHVQALASGRRIAWWHWIAPAVQFGWQAVLFPLPTAMKFRIDAAVIEPFLSPVSSVAVLASMAAYGVACWRALQRYERWLAERRRQLRPARRIRWLTFALVPLVAARAGYSLFEALVRPINYFDLFGYYILLGLVGLWLGLEGWRQAEAPAPAAEDEDARRSDQGAAWIERLRAQGWWRDADLSLADLARELGTNAASLSRALAPHGGFAAVLGGIRSEAAAARIAAGQGDDLLRLAMDCGFGSKASFNRAFRARFGTSPSAFRADGAKPTEGEMLAR
ncbi:helix-turn-helix transcriptional regulator [Sphingomonas lutea]|uniref:helix-turn-helix transcriptional regulator n=1 Tax=Sphingomonas lutea TaxID=1045317 RepID=UPI001F34E240|nr:AraC family transcriptional regulator [Sphingomonas lutea]